MSATEAYLGLRQTLSTALLILLIIFGKKKAL